MRSSTNSTTLPSPIPAFVPALPLSLWAGAVLIVGCLAQALPAELGETLKSEDGIFERASVVILGAGALLGITFALWRFSWVRLAGALVATAVLLRELDFQKRFTYRSIESIGFYTRPIATWTEKIVGLAVVATLAVALAVLARAAWIRYQRATRDREPWLSAVAVAGALVAGSLVSEKILGFTVAEEALEMGFAGAMVALLWQTRPATAMAQESTEVRPVPVFPFVCGLATTRCERRSSERDSRAA